MGTSDRKKTGHREITTHVSIHTIHLDGLRELYRHFLRLPDGAVVEVSILHIWLECLDMDPWHLVDRYERWGGVWGPHPGYEIKGEGFLSKFPGPLGLDLV